MDDVIAFAKDPLSVMKELEKRFLMKGVGAPRYYLGGDVNELDDQWQAEGLFHSFSADTYIGNCIPKMEAMMTPPAERAQITFRTRHVPMDPTYHPELDESPILDLDGISKYRSMIGSLNWILTLGRFDIAFALNAMSRYNMAPREGHAEAVMRIFGYLKSHRTGQIILDPGEPPIRSKAMVNTGFNWQELYPDACEDVLFDFVQPKGEKVTFTCYVDADHARDKLTRKSVTGIVLLMNNTPIVWISKRQKTVETSTYGSELIAARIAVDLLVEWRYKARVLGLELEDLLGC